MNVSALGCMNSLIKWLLKLSVLLLLGTWCDKVAERSDAHWKSSNEVAYRITERMRKENAREIGGFFDKYRIGRLGLWPTWYCKYKTLLQAAKFNKSCVFELVIVKEIIYNNYPSTGIARYRIYKGTIMFIVKYFLGPSSQGSTNILRSVPRGRQSFVYTKNVSSVRICVRLFPDRQLITLCS